MRISKSLSLLLKLMIASHLSKNTPFTNNRQCNFAPLTPPIQASRSRHIRWGSIATWVTASPAHGYLVDENHSRNHLGLISMAKKSATHKHEYLLISSGHPSIFGIRPLVKGRDYYESELFGSCCATINLAFPAPGYW